eukprot:CAMPEP_0167834008 /NCGR_PEP_ID=MMETSP0112_2-20121227/15375_1 /TAXON_ID=91324 /ORGANISM="Lotharella globosa, Strain CCCM811" /LENGTH=280 /DNA_ID=CAMNT_0007739563 /DNA_START=555 /DNA_END=1397 /DNA_ORIENTATION=+
MSPWEIHWCSICGHQLASDNPNLDTKGRQHFPSGWSGPCVDAEKAEREMARLEAKLRPRGSMQGGGKVDFRTLFTIGINRPKEGKRLARRTQEPVHPLPPTPWIDPFGPPVFVSPAPPVLPPGAALDPFWALYPKQTPVPSIPPFPADAFGPPAGAAFDPISGALPGKRLQPSPIQGMDNKGTVVADDWGGNADDWIPEPPPAHPPRSDDWEPRPRPQPPQDSRRQRIDLVNVLSISTETTFHSLPNVREQLNPFAPQMSLPQASVMNSRLESLENPFSF